MIKMNPYTQGYHSYGLDLPCPYVSLSAESMEWLEGFHDAGLDSEICDKDPDVIEAVRDLSSEDAGMEFSELLKGG